MGAAVSLNTVLRYPQRVKALLLIRNAWTDEPLPAKNARAYHDMGEALRDRDIEKFYASEGWRIVKEANSPYTTSAFTCTFEDEACLRYWEKYLLLPPQAPIPSVNVLQDLHIPVSILSCRSDMCHPFERGTYLHARIKGATFTEIPNKDEDGARHKAMINNAVRAMLGV